MRHHYRSISQHLSKKRLTNSRRRGRPTNWVRAATWRFGGQWHRAKLVINLPTRSLSRFFTSHNPRHLPAPAISPAQQQTQSAKTKEYIITHPSVPPVHIMQQKNISTERQNVPVYARTIFIFIKKCMHSICVILRSIIIYTLLLHSEDTGPVYGAE
jgi:hypothetical protein